MIIRDAPVIETDVLVVGGGGAAARSAIAADSMGVKTHMVVKGVFGYGGCTPIAMGGYAAAFGKVLFAFGVSL